MSSLQNTLISLFILINLFVFIKGFYQSNFKKNSFGLTPSLFPLGIFVWGDAVIWGLFWVLVSLFSIFLKDWLLFLLIISVFWLVRSLGEIIYWINQQFSPIIRNPPQTLYGYRWFKNDSIWFIYQIFWQCAMIISIVSTIYLTSLWLTTKF